MALKNECTHENIQADIEKIANVAKDHTVLPHVLKLRDIAYFLLKNEDSLNGKHADWDDSVYK